VCGELRRDLSALRLTAGSVGGVARLAARSIRPVYGRCVVLSADSDDPVGRFGILWNGGRAGPPGSTPAATNHTLHQLFVEGATVESCELDEIEPGLESSLRDEGLLEQVPAGLRATVRISRWRGLLIAHDSLPGDRIPSDIVLRPSPTTRTVAALTVRRSCQRALDVGTGCGALALLAAAHADEVVATDVNPRALWFTDLNARLNGVENVRCVEGDLFDPVSGGSFDLVMGNLPFVLSPDTEYLFRDGVRGERGDISERAVAAAADVLAPDGFATLLVNWVVADREAPAAAALSWVRASGCSGLVLSHSLQSPRTYATKWAQGSADNVEDWVAYLRARGAAAVANGAVVLHRSRQRKIRSAQMSVSPSAEGGRQVERILTASALDDVAVRASRPKIVMPHTTTARIRHDATGRTRQPLEIRLDDTAGVVGIVQPAVAEVIARLDGEVSVGDALAAQRVASPGTVSPELEAAVANTVRALVFAGIMEPGRAIPDATHLD
jgi:methylase of polypeptide subunit release factors